MTTVGIVKVEVKWNRGAVPYFERLLGLAIRGYLRMVRDEVRRVLSTPYPPASLPGQSPHMRTGELRDSIRDEWDERSKTGSVVAGAEHAGYLEDGTRRMAARPFAMKTVSRMLAAVRGYFTVGRSIGG